MLYDIAIVGGGPAGCSAAVTAANPVPVRPAAGYRGFRPGPAEKRLVKNYLGMSDRSGAELMDAFTAHMKLPGPRWSPTRC